MKDKLPSHYRFAKHKREQYIEAVETLGETLRGQGPLDVKTMHLVQLAHSDAFRRLSTSLSAKQRCLAKRDIALLMKLI